MQNGSHIHAWWIFHHYVSAFMSVTVLTWPTESKYWVQFLPQLTAFFLYQGVVQFLQARYQKARHYARVAMGKAHAMDVSNSETLAEFHAGLWLVVIFAVGAHVWQVYNGYCMFALLLKDLDVTQPWYRFREEVQCVVVGCMFLILGFTNFAVTVQTLADKCSRGGGGASKRQSPPPPAVVAPEGGAGAGTGVGTPKPAAAAASDAAAASAPAPVSSKKDA